MYLIVILFWISQEIHLLIFVRYLVNQIQFQVAFDCNEKLEGQAVYLHALSLAFVSGASKEVCCHFEWIWWHVYCDVWHADEKGIGLFQSILFIKFPIDATACIILKVNQSDLATECCHTLVLFCIQ